MPGIAQMSPTMARHRHRRRISKDQLAMIVRKDFNAAMIHEQEIVTSFLYALKNQGRFALRSYNSYCHSIDAREDKTFRMRFEASSAKQAHG